MQNFVLQTPSLQHLAGVKTMTQLWNQHDILTKIAQSFTGVKYYDTIEATEDWKAIEDQVRSKVSALPLPDPCKKELSTFMKPIGMETDIIAWCCYHSLDNSTLNFLFVDPLLPQQFCWTMHGTIDYAKTAETMVNEGRLSVESRYEIACLNCLEDQARQLMELIPNDRRLKYITEGERHSTLIVFFTCTFSDNLEQMNRLFRARYLRGVSINQYLFKLVLGTGTRATCEYFLKKVSQEEKERVLKEMELLAMRSKLSPMCGLMYYLSLLNAEQQECVFIEGMEELLPLLLHWPMQSFFMEAAKREWQFFDSELSENCAEVLAAIVNKIRLGYQDYGYTQSFKELWRLSPAEYKQRFLDDTDRLEVLIATNRKEFIQLVLKRAPLHRLKKLSEKRHKRISVALLDESAISDADLIEWKATAALKSSTDRGNVEKRSRSEYVSRLVDTVMECRIKNRVPIAGLATS